MAITNFIPTIWSENLYKSLDKKYVAVANCARDYEGEIKAMGDMVKICGVGDIVVGDYTKDTDMSRPQHLSDTCISFRIDRAKYFNFQIDDIDRTQATPKLMEAAMSNAASSLANEADAYVLSLALSSTHSVRIDDPTPESVVEGILKARTMLYEHNVLDNSEVVIEVSPAVASMIFKEKMALATDNSDMLENGCIGSIFGCKVFVSNNIFVDDVDGNLEHKCLVRTKRSIAYAEQLSEIEAYRPEKRFADAVKGLHLYGANIIYEDEIILLDVAFPID